MNRYWEECLTVKCVQDLFTDRSLNVSSDSEAIVTFTNALKEKRSYISKNNKGVNAVSKQFWRLMQCSDERNVH